MNSIFYHILSVLQVNFYQKNICFKLKVFIKKHHSYKKNFTVVQLTKPKWRLVDMFIFQNHNFHIVFYFSAGGIGVLQNIDRVSDLLSSDVNKKIDVRGLVDSAWVLDLPQSVTKCVDCNPNVVFKKAIK